MNSLVASVVWDEARFGLPLDLERFMIVAVGDFNMGAMENKGLNIFNTKYVLASAGDRDRQRLLGDRIGRRPRVLPQLDRQPHHLPRLVPAEPEGRPDGLSRPGVQHGHGGERERARDRQADRATCAACARCSSPKTPARWRTRCGPTATSRSTTSTRSTVYEKGAEVVRMMQTLVGRDGFARGMTLYFERHDGQAVTCDDFAQAIADANPASDLARLLPQFKRWYSQVGHAEGDRARPLRRAVAHLHARPRAGARATAATATSRSSSRWRWAWSAATGERCRCASRTKRRRRRATSRVLVLDDNRSFFTFVDVDQPPVLSLLRGFSAPVVLVDGLGDADLLVLLRHDSDPFNRWEAGQRLALHRLLAAVRSGEPAPLDADFVDGDARRAAPPGARRRVQGAGPHAAERGLRRRAARHRRPADASTPRARR